MKSFKIVLLVVFLSITSTSYVQAAEKNQDSWEFNLAPFYLWGVNIDGDMKVGPTSNQVNVPFNDIFDNLDAAFIFHFEAKHSSNWGGFIDVNYLDLESKQAVSPNVTSKYDIDMTLSEAGGTYSWQFDSHRFDALAGVRYTRIDTKIGVLGGPNLVDAAKSWTDPIVGGRWIYNFSDNWSLITRGDIGGFGVGSDFSWQAVGIVEWQPFTYASFLAGYRAIGMDYEDGSGADYFNFDATIHGPVLGLNFKW